MFDITAVLSNFCLSSVFFVNVAVQLLFVAMVCWSELKYYESAAYASNVCEPNTMRAVYTVFLVVKANSKYLQLKEVFATDENGNLLPPLHFAMSSVYPGGDTFHCLDQNNETQCLTRLGDRDPWLEIEYPLDNGVGQVGIINADTDASRATVAIYKDHKWQQLLWEGRFGGKNNVLFWNGAFSFPLLLS